MNKAQFTQQALELSERDRFELAQTLWVSIDDPNAFPTSFPLPEWQKQLLDERLEASTHDAGEDWERVKAEIWPETR